MEEQGNKVVLGTGVGGRKRIIKKEGGSRRGHSGLMGGWALERAERNGPSNRPRARQRDC